ncbi:MAG: YqaA family protein [Alphaproteobacteria bacterium]
MVQALLSPLRRLYDWTMSLAGHRHAVWWLAFISFVESSFFPIPPDVLLIPLVLAARHRAFRIAGICTIASVVGGAFGYLIGYGLMDTVGLPIIEFYGHVDALDDLSAAFAEHGWLIVIGGGLTPLPYKIVTIASGALHLDFTTFMLASLGSRGVRFLLVAALLWRFGPSVRRLIEERFGLMTAIFFILLVGGFIALKFAL